VNITISYLQPAQCSGERLVRGALQLFTWAVPFALFEAVFRAQAWSLQLPVHRARRSTVMRVAIPNVGRNEIAEQWTQGAAWEAFLKDEAPRLLARAQQHQLEFKDLWEGQDEAAIGRVLRCHLLVEHYLTRFLQAANPALGDADVARLGFWQKLKLATGSAVLKRGLIDLYSPGIEALNTVRNRMSHRLRSELDPEDIKPMAEMVEAYAKVMNNLCLKG
jgi:hypothetical protein